MGLFNSIFGKSERRQEESNVQWIPLNDLEQIHRIKEESNSEAVLIFKHSTRCGISSMVIKQFEKKFTEEMKHIKVYYLDLLNYRDISDEISYTFQVMHQSPQLLIIKSGIPVMHASHYDITLLDIEKLAS
jgi:bacillithiol system protein YtxJ